MRDDRVLPFPARGDGAPDDDAAVAARLAALYAAMPTADAARVAACTREVLARAQSDAGRSRRLIGGGVRWWWGAAAAALAFVSVQWGRVQSGRPVVADSTFADGTGSALGASPALFGTTTPMDGGSAVRFDLRVPASAKAVAIVGDFNGWNGAATPMVLESSGRSWSVRVPLSPGRHVYAFVVNGDRWLVDPLAPQVPDSGYGPSNALIVEGEPR